MQCHGGKPAHVQQGLRFGDLHSSGLLAKCSFLWTWRMCPVWLTYVMSQSAQGIRYTTPFLWSGGSWTERMEKCPNTKGCQISSDRLQQPTNVGNTTVAVGCSVFVLACCLWGQLISITLRLCHMAHFMVLVCNICAKWLSPRKECSRHHNLLGQGVVWLEIQISVRMCYLSMDCSWERPIRVVWNHSIQECKFAISLWFKSKLNGSFDRVEVAMEGRDLV